MMEQILAEIADERARQDAKFGNQYHPCVNPSEINYGDHDELRRKLHVAASYGMPSEQEAREECSDAASEGRLTWGHIAVEELSEAICSKTVQERRAELVQLAAVAVAWIECIDRHQLAGNY